MVNDPQPVHPCQANLRLYAAIITAALVDPIEAARDRYVRGDIEIDQFEAEVAEALLHPGSLTHLA